MAYFSKYSQNKDTQIKKAIKSALRIVNNESTYHGKLEFEFLRGNREIQKLWKVEQEQPEFVAGQPEEHDEHQE